MTTVTLVLTKPPYSSSAATEHLDMALAGGNFGADVSVIFIDDGVLSLLKNQQPQVSLDAKNPAKTYAALPFYDVENIYACNASLSDRGVKREDLIEQVTVIEAQELKQQLHNTQHVVVF